MRILGITLISAILLSVGAADRVQAADEIVKIRGMGVVRVYDADGVRTGKISHAEIDLPLEVLGYAGEGRFLKVEIRGTTHYLNRQSVVLGEGPATLSNNCFKAKKGQEKDATSLSTRSLKNECD